MYFLINENQNKIQTFYNPKTKTMAQISELPDEKKRTPSYMWHFGVISLINVFTSRTLIQMHIPRSYILFLVYLLSLLFGLILFVFSKKKQTEKLNNFTIEYSKYQLDSFLQTTKNEGRRLVIKLATLFFISGLFCGILFYFNSENVILLILIWLIMTMSSWFYCEPILYYVHFKNSA